MGNCGTKDESNTKNIDVQSTNNNNKSSTVKTVKVTVKTNETVAEVKSNTNTNTTNATATSKSGTTANVKTIAATKYEVKDDNNNQIEQTGENIQANLSDNKGKYVNEYNSYLYEVNDSGDNNQVENVYGRYATYDDNVVNASRYGGYFSSYANEEEVNNETNTTAKVATLLKRMNSYDDELLYNTDEIKSEYDRVKDDYERAIQSTYYRFDWDYKRQEIYKRNVAGPADERKRAADLNQLNSDFRDYITPIAKAIITRRIYKSSSVDSDGLFANLVTPTNMGGLAGGEKFLIGKVLFKFAHNDSNIYSSEMSAQKAAELEIKAYDCIVDSRLHLLNYAMTAIVKYRGYCLVAVAYLPLEGGKLVYGSCDASQTVTVDKDAEKQMSQLAEYCHVRRHKVVERSTSVVKHVYLGVDVEGHMSQKGTMYILDVARLSSPTLPPRNHGGDKSAYLTRHFRFELLRSSRNAQLEPLSCDAFSRFSHVDERAADEERCNAMMNFLLNKQVVRVVEDLKNVNKPKDVNNDHEGENNDWRQDAMRNIFKEYGVNMRYIPSVATRLHQKYGNDSTGKEWYEYLCEEMIVRHLKVHIRGGWNDMIGCGDSVIIFALRDLMIEFAVNGEQGTWWDIMLKEIRVKYNDVEEDTAYVIKKIEEIVYNRNHYNLVFRLLKALHIDYAGSLNSIENIVKSSKSWTLKVLVKQVKAPEFLTLGQREKVINDEIAWRESLGNSIVTPLAKLIGIYRLWRAEAPDITFERGDQVAKRFAVVVNASEEEGADPKYRTHEVGWAMYEVAEFYQHFGKYEESLKWFKRELKVFEAVYGREHRDVAGALHNIARVYDSKSQFGEALKHYEESLAIKKKILGTEHQSLAVTLMNMGLIFNSLGKYSKALENYDEALRLYKKFLGPEHVSIGRLYNNRGLTLDNLHKYDEALDSYYKAIAIYESAVGKNTLLYAGTLNNIAMVLKSKGKLTDALEKYQEALDVKKKVVGERHITVGRTLNNMGLVLKAQKKNEEALTYFNNALSTYKSCVGELHLLCAGTMNNIAMVHDTDGRYDDALKWYNHSLDIKKKLVGDNHLGVGRTLYNIGIVLANRNVKKYDEALKNFNRAYEIRSSQLPEGHKDIRDTNWWITETKKRLKE